MGSWSTRHDLNCWLGRKTSTQTKLSLFKLSKHSATSKTRTLIGTLVRMLNHDQYLSPDMTKQTKWVCAQRRLRSAVHPPSLIRVFAVRMKKAWVLSYPLSASEDSDPTGRMPRLIWVFGGRTVTLLVLSCRGSFRNSCRSIAFCSY